MAMTLKQGWSARLENVTDESPIPFAGWEDWDEEGVLHDTSPLRWRLG